MQLCEGGYHCFQTKHWTWDAYFSTFFFTKMFPSTKCKTSPLVMGPANTPEILDITSSHWWSDAGSYEPCSTTKYHRCLYLDTIQHKLWLVLFCFVFVGGAHHHQWSAFSCKGTWKFGNTILIITHFNEAYVTTSKK